VLLDRVAHPVNLGVTGDSGVVNIYHDDLEVLVGRVLAYPIRVHDPQTLESSPNPFFGNGLEVPLRLLLLHSTRSLWFTIGTTFGHRALATTATHGDAVNDKS